MNKQILAITAFALILISTSIVYAFGVSSPYWEGNPLVMSPGETKTINLNLQNMVGNENVTVKAEIKKGSEIARIEKDIYTVLAGTADSYVPLKITIPRNAENNSRIEIEFKTITPGAGGGVAMGTGMTVSFDVVISEIEVGAGKITWKTAILMLIAVIIVLAIIIYLVLRKKKAK